MANATGLIESAIRRFEEAKTRTDKGWQKAKLSARVATLRADLNDRRMGVIGAESESPALRLAREVDAVPVAR